MPLPTGLSPEPWPGHRDWGPRPTTASAPATDTKNSKGNTGWPAGASLWSRSSRGDVGFQHGDVQGDAAVSMQPERGGAPSTLAASKGPSGPASLDPLPSASLCLRRLPSQTRL